MTREEALQKEDEINAQIILLTRARAHYSLIASGMIEAPEGIAEQKTKGDALAAKVDVGVIKGAKSVVK